MVKTLSKYVRHLGFNSFNVLEMLVGRWKSGFVPKNRHHDKNQKVPLKIFQSQNPRMQSSKIYIFRLACEDFQIDKKFKVLFDFCHGFGLQNRPILGVSSITHLHCKSTKLFNFCIFLHSYVNLFIVWPIPNTKNTFLALKVVIWKLGQMGLERILYLGVCLNEKNKA